MKLLYAEDEQSMSEAVVDILTYNKYIVDAVYDGQEALDYARSEQYDGIILDIMMPKMSGLEVLKQLRKEGCKTPVLLLTAKAEVEDRIEGLAAEGFLRIGKIRGEKDAQAMVPAPVLHRKRKIGFPRAFPETDHRRHAERLFLFAPAGAVPADPVGNGDRHRDLHRRAERRIV